MAESIALKLKFDTMSGSRTWTYKYAKPAATTANVKALAQAMIANGSIYQTQPVALTDARLVTTSETVYDIS